MKRTLLFCLLIILGALSLTGCSPNQNTANDLFKSLQKEKIIDNGLEAVDTVCEVHTVLFVTRTNYYIYKDENGKLLAVAYQKNINGNNDYDYLISIYNDVSVNNDIEYSDDTATLSTYYIYENNKKSEQPKYDFDNETTFYAYKHNSLFSKHRYKIIQADPKDE